jgi:hypothetical protein
MAFKERIALKLALALFGAFALVLAGHEFRTVMRMSFLPEGGPWAALRPCSFNSDLLCYASIESVRMSIAVAVIGAFVGAALLTSSLWYRVKKN